MTDVDGKIDRLLRAAALAKEEASLDAPFGFDTRVVALWRAKEKAASLGLARLVRRVAFIAVAVAIVAGAGAYREAGQSRESGEPVANEFAIADSAIQDEFLQ
ncbi:MAG: hypothetical protein WA183_10340 [Chthoniobacterales bacterium]